MKGILHDLYAWHKDKKAYDQSNRRQESGKTVYLPGMAEKWLKDGPSSDGDLLQWTNFKSFLKKCHRKLCQVRSSRIFETLFCSLHEIQSFIECIEAGDFMHVYNAVLIMKEIIDVFPLASVNEVAGSNLGRVMQRLVQHEERGDLKILAIS